MWTKLPVILAALALSAPPVAALAEAPVAGLSPEERRQIAAIPEEYVERALAGDWQGVADLYHPEAIQVLPDTPPAEGRDAIRDALAGLLGTEGGVRLTDFSVDLHETEVLGEAIFVQATYRFEVELLGRAEGSLEQHGPYANLLRPDADGTWRIWRQFVGRAHPPLGPAAE